MKIEMLFSKIKQMEVTRADFNYNKGSITIDQDIMDRANLLPYQGVDVNNKNSNARIHTYIIPGERGSYCCELNGAAARGFMEGDIVHVNAYCNMVPDEAKDWEPIII